VPEFLLVVSVVILFLRFPSTECIYPQRPESTFIPKKTKCPKDWGDSMIKTGEQPTEKILVTPSTKQDLTSLKQPGERYGDVIARLVRGQKQQDYIAQILRVAKEGDFVPMESDDEYRKIKKEVLNVAPRNRKAGTAIH
jgi:predicted CopG family antitoxin